jgi:hypothetical protein
MHVQVRYCLPSRFAVIDADVISGRMELVIHGLLLSFEQLEHRRSLSVVKIEKRGNVSARNYEGVAGRNRVPIANGECLII